MPMPPSPSLDLSSPAQKRTRQHWLGPLARPPRHPRPRPPAPQIMYFVLDISVIKSQKDMDDLMGEPPGLFLHIHVTFTHPLVKVGI
jgi:hypothetical protein